MSGKQRQESQKKKFGGFAAAPCREGADRAGLLDEDKFKSHTTMASEELKRLVHSGKIRFAGNRKLKIYGRLDCTSGKRMKIINRVFFSSEAQAADNGFRPCGHCLPEKYFEWKHATP